MHHRSLFDRLEMINLVKEIESRRESVDASLPIVNLFPSVMQYAEQAIIRREEEERLAALSKEVIKKKTAAISEVVVKQKEEDHQQMVS